MRIQAKYSEIKESKYEAIQFLNGLEVNKIFYQELKN